MTPSTSSSAGHDVARDLDAVSRAERARAHDRVLARAVKALVKWSLLLGLPSLLVVAIAWPSWGHPFGCRARQSEARGNLKALYVGEASYFAEYDRYVADADTMGFAPRGGRIRYDYFVRTDATSFEGFAVGREQDVVGDIWKIDETNDLEHLVDGCPR